jgi:hypothetical protein
MQEIDMSKPGTELFPESTPMQYNSYQDVNVDQVVDDPLNMGVKQQSLDVAEQAQPASDKEMNFRALSDVVAKLKEEREYWKGQAEAYSSQPAKPQPTQAPVDPYSSLDWESSKDVQKAFEAIRYENQMLRQEMKDSIAAVETKAQHQDWNNMVKRHVPELTSKNPIFAEMIQKVSNPYEAAYLLAELNAKASQPASASGIPQQQNYNGQRALNNAQKPQTLASIGGGGTLSSADYYASMSDDDFMKIASRNLANI